MNAANRVDGAAGDRVTLAALAEIGSGMAGTVSEAEGQAVAPPSEVRGKALGLREHEASTQRWFCLQHAPFQGGSVRAAVTRIGFGAHWPRYIHRPPQRDETLVPVFPGYLFVRFDAARPSWSRIVRVDGVVGIVGVRETGAPLPVLPGYVERWIEAAGGADGLIDLRGKVPGRGVPPGIAPGTVVEMVSGVMAGLRGVMQGQAGRDRVSVMLSGAVGLQHRVTVPRLHVQVAQ